MPSMEILAVLADEVSEAGDAIGAPLAVLATTTDEPAFLSAMADYVEPIQRIAAACEAVHLDGIQRVCAFVERNLAALIVGDFDNERQALFEHWPVLVLGYLRAPLDGVYSRELVESFRHPRWPEPLDQTAAEELERTLLALSDKDHADADAEPVREREAMPEDVSLGIAEDMNPRLLDAFLTEGPQQTGEYSALIQRIVHGDGWVDELNECRRLIHGLKGAANTVGVRGVAMLCHHVEDILEYLVENAVQPEGELARLLVKVADTLEMMFEALLGTGEAPEDAQAVLQMVLDWVNRIDRGEYDAAASHRSDSAVSEPTIALTETASAEARAISTAPAANVAQADAASAKLRRAQAQPVMTGAAKADEKVEPKVRVAARAVDAMLRNSGEITISCGHVLERLQQAFAVLAELRERQNTLWDHSVKMEGFVTTRGIAAGRRQALATVGGASPAGFDPLEMDQYSELHTYVHELTETVTDLQLLGTRMVDTLTAVDTAVNQQTLLNNDLHDLLMTSRMIPVANLQSRLERTIRQVAEQCGKQAALTIAGADVMLDDQMLNALIDPLQHLLRNAVDHGLEPASDRSELGKPETGRVALTFARDGNYLVITCGDDGAGLDLTRIRAHAVTRGFIAEDQELREEEVARLILRSGFSTAETVTEVSGRGVGMDVVHTSVAKLKGSIDIRTQAGLGATFTLRVPMSMGIVHCLLAIAAHQTFALPIDNLERIVYGGGRHVQQLAGGWAYDDGETKCPAHSLVRLLGYAENSVSDPEGGSRHVVLLDDIDGQVAIVVDAVTGGNDLVIKKMGRYLTGVKGILGASILGDGTVVPILQLTELFGIQRGELSLEQGPMAPADAAMLKTDILVVDDSLSVRTALATLFVEEGFRVRTAKDGIEAIEAISERLPAMVVADLEMPRMNGLELTAHIRTNVATRTLPVILVTSRTAEKHRNQAKAVGVDAYVTKPYREADLLIRVRTMLSKGATQRAD